MGTGFIIGGVWGLIAAAGALAVASLMSDPPRRAAVEPEADPAGRLEAEPGDVTVTDVEPEADAATVTTQAGPDAVAPSEEADVVVAQAGTDAQEADEADQDVIVLSGEAEVVTLDETGTTGAQEEAGDETAEAGDVIVLSGEAEVAQTETEAEAEAETEAEAVVVAEAEAEAVVVADTEAEAEAEADTEAEAVVVAQADEPEAVEDAAPEIAEGPPPPVSVEAPQAPAPGVTEAARSAPRAPAVIAQAGPLPGTPRADVPAGRGAAPLAETAPELRPETSGDVAGPATPPETGEAPRLASGAEEPVLPGPPSRVIEIPAGESDITVVTDPPPPPSQSPREVVEAMPETPDDGATGDGATGDGATGDGATGDGATGDGASGAAEPGMEAAEGERRLAVLLPPEGGEGAETDADADADADARIGTATDADTATAGPPRRVPSPRPRPQGLRDGDEGGDGMGDAGRRTVTVMPAPDGTADGLPGRGAGLDRGDAVPVRRPGSERAGAEAAPAPAPLPDDAPAYLRYATPDTADPAAPRLSVVLHDDGTFDDPVAAVSSIPFDLTIGLDPAAPGAAARARRWREAGFEIAAMAELPPRPTPQDVETGYEAAFAALPEAVALLDAGGAGLAADGDVTRQALDRLARDGRGLVALSQGLATPLRQAEARGVPALEVYRDLGEVAQDDRAIRRFLQQAAFRARQEGAVTLLADLNPETITALTLWGNRVDREGVVPAPVSALLRMQMAGTGK